MEMGVQPVHEAIAAVCYDKQTYVNAWGGMYAHGASGGHGAWYIVAGQQLPTCTAATPLSLVAIGRTSCCCCV